MTEKPSINPRVNSSYMVRNVSDLLNSKGESIEIKPVFNLCSCGGSNNKPFCDGTHQRSGFSSDKVEGRRPDRVDTYRGKVITIYDNQAVCTKAGFCVEQSPDIFNHQRTPWIDPDAGDAEKTAATIRLCPSGALSYKKGKEYYIEKDREPSITITKNGPYNMIGGIELNDPQGSKSESAEHYSLCRCGASKNKPFCDGNHQGIEFKDGKN